MKLLFLTALSAMLTSCYYSQGCLITPQEVACFNEQSTLSTPSPISTYQKSNMAGRTDKNQRWIDAVSCGAEYGDDSLRSVVFDSNGIFNKQKGEKFDDCMYDKDYIILSLKDCYTKNRLNGKCN
ncbi:hypothetical protein [Moraxella sp. RCAD0137]|uniref:hypothetical protein n=1 Tax=Moraxella sp. RCAD0137 TaxID=1775913 RepID=UPI000C9FEA1E|nr:hypothetical protein [Moraxella sp. RCAD0137]